MTSVDGLLYRRCCTVGARWLWWCCMQLTLLLYQSTQIHSRWLCRKIPKTYMLDIVVYLTMHIYIYVPVVKIFSILRTHYLFTRRIARHAMTILFGQNQHELKPSSKQWNLRNVPTELQLQLQNFGHSGSSRFGVARHRLSRTLLYETNRRKRTMVLLMQTRPNKQSLACNLLAPKQYGLKMPVRIWTQHARCRSIYQAFLKF